jgi:biopolymer transport protein ExbD
MTQDLFISTFNFIENHILDVILVILILFSVMIYNVVNKVKFTTPRPQLQRVVVVETFSPITSKLSKLVPSPILV